MYIHPLSSNVSAYIGLDKGKYERLDLKMSNNRLTEPATENGHTTSINIILKPLKLRLFSSEHLIKRVISEAAAEINDVPDAGRGPDLGQEINEPTIIL
jgi:hypothetical protein